MTSWSDCYDVMLLFYIPQLYFVFNCLIVVVIWSGCFVEWVSHLTKYSVNPEAWTYCKGDWFLYYVS